ncbi:MAG: hypothetical protein U9N87_08270 [Planctomycetota bacterium]|nr:hypothetical protein [Planctomycetota bacterium]
MLAVILLTSILIRIVSLFSWPILEIDIYRYIWDGAVTLEGTSPYRYSPEQALLDEPQKHFPEDLRRLIELRKRSPALGTILSNIHYGELPTIYPPVSQAVFAVAVFVTPVNAGVFTHMVVMKSVLVLFDLGTLMVVIGLLRLAGRHVGWSVAYGWCPLVIKEVANTGHLDSLAVFLTTLALYFAVKPLADGVRGRRVQAIVAAMLLALAVGAKLYPIVLVPMLILLWCRTQSWRWAIVATAIFLVTATIVLWPMVPLQTAGVPPHSGTEVANGVVPLPPLHVADVEPQDPTGGLKAFLSRWEMNDFLFMLVHENLKPAADVEPARRAWFLIVPEDWKAAVLSIPSQQLEMSEFPTAFILARLFTAIVFVLVVGLLLWQAKSSDDPTVWLRAAFLTLAWLWLLSPTQNPWYWTWALPLVMFARSRAWLVLSGLTMIYYLRFWLIYHWPEPPLLGTRYGGESLFDFVITWIEFGPWLLWLAWETIRRGPNSAGPAREDVAN